MGKLLVVLLALLAPTLAHAATFKDQRGELWDLPMPPQRYQTPYTDTLKLFPMSEEEISEICSEAVGKAEPFGCAFILPGECSVYVSEDLPPRFRLAVEAHERAHCAGWPADHPVD
jgi:hypothetical protein